MMEPIYGPVHSGGVGLGSGSGAGLGLILGAGGGGEALTKPIYGPGHNGGVGLGSGSGAGLGLILGKAGKNGVEETGCPPEPGGPPLWLRELPARPPGTFRGIKRKRKPMGCGEICLVTWAPSQQLISLRPSNFVCACCPNVG